MTRAFVFPGQGSQTAGMGKPLAMQSTLAARIFEEVDDALGEKLSSLIFDGDEETLNLTRNAQPALMAVSVAAARVLLDRLDRPLPEIASFVAGHSLGEYSALAVAGCLSVGDAARLLRRRGEAMQDAVPVGQGAMAALLGLDLDVATAVAAEAAGEEVCVAANDNAPGQIVISGHRAAVERAMEIASGRGARRCVLLPVSAPFHCPLMAPAAQIMADALAQIDLNMPAVPVVTNVSATAVTDPPELRRLLVEQVTARVRWRECVEYMCSRGVTQQVEIGAGRVLTGLARRIDKSLTGTSVSTPDDVESFAGAV